MKAKRLSLALLILLALQLGACREEGPLEKAGRKTDNAIDKAEDKIKDAVD